MQCNALKTSHEDTATHINVFHWSSTAPHTCDYNAERQTRQDTHHWHQRCVSDSQIDHLEMVRGPPEEVFTQHCKWTLHCHATENEVGKGEEYISVFDVVPEVDLFKVQGNRIIWDLWGRGSQLKEKDKMQNEKVGCGGHRCNSCVFMCDTCGWLVGQLLSCVGNGAGYDNHNVLYPS